MIARSFQRTHVTVLFAIGMLMVSAIFTAMAVNATKVHPVWPVRVLIAACALGCPLLGFAELRMYLKVDDSGVHVRNLFSGFDVRWDEIDSFQRPEYPSLRDGFRGRYGIRIITKRHGTRYVCLWARGRFNKPSFADHIIADLEHRRLNRSTDQ